MYKVLSVFGTRPEAIKMAPLIKKLEKFEKIESKVCITGQHKEMLNSVLNIFDIEADYNLNVFKHNQSVIEIMTKTMNGVNEILLNEKFDLVLVHGDTIATSAVSQVAFLNKVKVGHVEAGLRSGNIYSPFPEEANRKITGVLANIHFAPTIGNYNNLIFEGIKKDIHIVGNTVIDAMLSVIEDNYTFQNEFLNNFDFENKKIVLFTCHRRENWGKPMEDIFNAMKYIATKNENVHIIYPVHLNPNIKELANKILSSCENIHLIEPLDYKPFANLINKVDLVVTDSGGVQEEAPTLGKPVLVVRTETERPEAVNAGTVKVIGVNKENIVSEIQLLIDNEAEYKKMSNAVNPYGDGKTSEKIVDLIYDYLKFKWD